MRDDEAQIGREEAQTMLELFASVGASHFDVTETTLTGAKDSFRSRVSLAELSRTLPALLDSARTRQCNVIVRPHGPDVTFIQLDDLNAGNLSRLAPAVFLALETSPKNFQGWVALKEPEDKDFSRRFRKGVGADPSASGATRVAGSRNFKEKYAPQFPRVTIRAAHKGRLATVAELERLGLVAAPEAAPAPNNKPPARSRPGPGNRKWPNYAYCVDGAPLNHGATGPDISKADFVWCMTALTWGWSIEDTAKRLMEESTKAKENGERYAALTAENAARAVERRYRQPTRHRTEPR